MSKIELLNEDLLLVCDLELTESDGPKGKELFLSGIMMQGDVKNRNNRVYPKAEIENAVQGINERLGKGETVLGELDHPQTLTVNLERVSHKMVEAKMVGNNAVGKLKILDTPMGRIAKEFIGEEVKLGVSSRGTGQVGSGGRVSNFAFQTMDIVAQPSAPEAFPESIRESLELYANGKVESIQTLAEAVVGDVRAQRYFRDETLRAIDAALETLLKT